MIISILNQKGGSGKTTLTINLAIALLNDNYKVLIVDSDPQGSIRDWDSANDKNIITVIALDTAKSISNIKSMANSYDFVLIDGAPQLSKHTAAAINVSNIILIPVQPSPFDVWATKSLVDGVEQSLAIGHKVNPYFVISRAIINTKLATEAKTAIKDYNIPVFSNYTCNRVSYSETAAVGQTVFNSKDKKAKLEMTKIKNELLEVISNATS